MRLRQVRQIDRPNHLGPTVQDLLPDLGRGVLGNPDIEAEAAEAVAVLMTGPEVRRARLLALPGLERATAGVRSDRIVRDQQMTAGLERRNQQLREVLLIRERVGALPGEDAIEG